MHKIEMSPALIERLMRDRGGKRHAFEDIVPARTAHVVVDMQNGFVAPGAPVEVPVARAIVPNVNAIAGVLRAAGGLNVFAQFTTPPDLSTWSNFYARLPAEKRERHQKAFLPGAQFWQLWPELDVADEDLKLEKGRFSAFVADTCDLHAILQARGIDTLIVTGTLSNCCCESTARDAMQLNYKVIFVADANAALTDEDHNATLNSLAARFADVMTTDEVLSAIARAGARSAEAA
jgi:ureidoacrylate peracid hydrolase